MPAIVECVPNFSEGRDEALVRRIADAARLPGCAVLDVERDADHHRMVLTLAGAPEAVLEAAFRCACVAVKGIDLTRHKGQHPRMGALDVCPFVPVAGITMAECAALARRLGERMGRELEVPVFLYAEAASRPDRVRLPDIRKGEFEGMRGRDLEPDFGPVRAHPTAGATAVGARPFLIAFNVNLDTPDPGHAKAIAKGLRESDGGLPKVQAKGFAIEEGKASQISMNLLDWTVTSPGKVFDLVCAEAARRGIGVRGSEIVGLIPSAALQATAIAHLRPIRFTAEQVFEARLAKALPPAPTLEGFLADLASSRPTPGGGSAAALSGAMGAALAGMVAALTAGKKGYEAVDAEMRALAGEAAAIQADLLRLMAEDAAAFDGVSAAMKLPKGSPGRAEAMQKALVKASEVPLETMRACLQVLALAASAAGKGNVHAVSDAAVAALSARAGLEGASFNVLINAGSIRDAAEAARLRDEAARLCREGREAEAAVLAKARERMTA